MAQNRDARVVLRELLLDTFGQRRGAARLRVLGHDDDRRVLALAEAVVDEFGQLVHFGFHFGYDRRFGTRGDGAVHRQITRRVAHYLDEEEPLVARHVVFLGEDAGARERTVAADDHQRVDAGRHHVVVCRLAAFGRGEFLTAGRLEDRTAQLDDVAYALGFERHDLVEYETFVSAHDALDGEAVIDCAAGYRAYGGVHSRSVAARSQNTDTFDSSHSFSFRKQNRSKVVIISIFSKNEGGSRRIRPAFRKNFLFYLTPVAFIRSALRGLVRRPAVGPNPVLRIRFCRLPSALSPVCRWLSPPVRPSPCRS